MAKAAGASGVGNLGTVTAESPAAGTRVAAGTTVTLTYTLTKVTVPSEIGRTDLATAEAGIRAAGLVPKAVGASGAGNKGKVTAESPAAGTKVNKGPPSPSPTPSSSVSKHSGKRPRPANRAGPSCVPETAF